MVATNFETPAGHASLANITHGFQMFPKGWVSFVMTFQMVFFAYQAIEFVGITTSETANPRKVLPKRQSRRFRFVLSSSMWVPSLPSWLSSHGKNFQLMNHRS